MGRILKKCGIALALLLTLSIIGSCAAIPLINDRTAENVAEEVRALPLPENTTYCESFSMAGKLIGNGNGIQYLGGILVESTLSLEDLRTFYSGTAEVKIQEGQELAAIEHGRYTLKTQVQDGSFYIIYAFGSGNEICRELDIRGH